VVADEGDGLTWEPFEDAHDGGHELRQRVSPVEQVAEDDKRLTLLVRCKRHRVLQHGQTIAAPFVQACLGRSTQPLVVAQVDIRDEG